MLETVLKIGNAFRKSETSFKNYRYIKQFKLDNKRKALILSLPVNIINDNSLSFDFDKLHEIIDENIIENKLFYLTYKTSDSDGLVKYIFGDIYYSYQKEKEGGYYRLGDTSNKQKAYQKSSFYRGEEDFQSIQKQYKEESNLISSFRKEFEINIEYIENIIQYKSAIAECLKKENFKQLLLNKEYLETLTAKNTSPPADLFFHFDFGGRYWYEFDNEIELINKKLIEEFTEKNDNPEGYVLKKALYKTIASAEKDFQFPYFQEKSKYRVKLFQKIEDVLDLFYAIDYSEKALIIINDIKIIVLPKGNNITALQYEKFNQKINSIEQEQEKEDKISNENMTKTPDDMLFTPITENIAENIVEFDLIFSKSGKGVSSPDIDMIEFSSIKKSNLIKLHQRIKDIKKNILKIQENELSEKQKETIKDLDIKNSFKNIFKDLKSDTKKYQSHLYKVLPQIYTGTYYKDPVLLPALIETTEKNIRSEENLSFPKYDFYFLTEIQNTLKQGEYLMSIKNSKSYQIGLLLGEIARQFAAWRNDCPIKSFEKSYIGTLSRRIATINDLIKFKSFIEEKLILHERSKFTFETSVNLSEKIKELELSAEKYDKNKCAFGFFESYFAQTKNEKQESTDNINETN
jgi:hypothetical protein